MRSVQSQAILLHVNAMESHRDAFMSLLTADFSTLNCGALAYQRLTQRDDEAFSAHVLVSEIFPMSQTWTDAFMALVCRHTIGPW